MLLILIPIFRSLLIGYFVDRNYTINNIVVSRISHDYHLSNPAMVTRFAILNKGAIKDIIIEDLDGDKESLYTGVQAPTNNGGSYYKTFRSQIVASFNTEISQVVSLHGGWFPSAMEIKQPLQWGKNNYGQITTIFDCTDMRLFIIISASAIISLIFLAGLFVSAATYFGQNILVKPLHSFSNAISLNNIEESKRDILDIEAVSKETYELQQTLVKYYNTREQILKQRVEIATLKNAVDQLKGLLHHFKNPISKILFISNRLKSGKKIKESSLDSLKISAENAIQISKTIAKFETETTFNKQRINVLTVIEKLVNNFAHQRGDSFISNKCSKSCYVFSDECLLNELFSNLTINAIEEEDSTYLSISSLEDDNFVTISFENDGLRLTDDEVNQMTNISFTKNKKNGTGIGLFLVKFLCYQMGGSLEISTENQSVISFSVKIPKGES